MPLLILHIHSHTCVSPSVSLTRVPKYIFFITGILVLGVCLNKVEFVPLLKLFSLLTNTKEDIKNYFSGKPSEYRTGLLFFLLALYKYGLIYTQILT